MGIVMLPVPVTGVAVNFSPMPRIAPPPLGSEMAGDFTKNSSVFGAAERYGKTKFIPPVLLTSLEYSPPHYLLKGTIFL